jgi:hypothetical protein
VSPSDSVEARKHLDGAQRIAEERNRQVALGYGRAHDRDEHDDGALLKAAALYTKAALIIEHAPMSLPGVRRVYETRGEVPEDDEDFRQMVENPARHWFGWDSAPREWPWEPESWNPSMDAVRNLEKAGALIAAEIDRLTQNGGRGE